MKVQILILYSLFAVLYAAAINKNYPHVLPTDTQQCSTNASTAYVDIILVIDTSTNMGTANLRKIATTLSLILPKFTIGNQADISKGYRNTRIGVVTYNTQATIAANFSDINSFNDIANVLNGLSSSNSPQANLYDAFEKAGYIKTNCTDILHCSESLNYLRPAAIILFAASVNDPRIGDVPDVILFDEIFEMATLITVNFNTGDQALTSFLNNVTYNNLVNASMYNLTSSSNTLSRDLEWAILQANCYCGEFTAYEGVPIVYFDKANNRYSKYAECILLKSYLGNSTYFPSNTIHMCGHSTYAPQIPSFILTEDRKKFIESIFMGIDPNTGLPHYPFYIGLHKNAQGQWAWYNYDLTEFSLSGYTDWAAGYPDNSNNNCAVFDSDDGQHLVWKNSGCNPQTTAIGSTLCQAQACDASSISCWGPHKDGKDGNSLAKKQKSTRKNRLRKQMKMVNGKSVRVA